MDAGQTGDRITKSDVPYIYRGLNAWLMMICSAGILAVGMFVEPRFRPGVIEAIIGLLGAWVAASISSLALINYASDLALAAKSDKLVKVTALRLGDARSQWQQAGFVAMSGMFGVCVAGYLLYLAVPTLAMPWAHFSSVASDEWPIQSMACASGLHLLAYYFLQAFHLLKWYNGLPENGP